MTKKETVVISVGGSLISPPPGLNVQFLKKLRAFIEKHTKQGYHFVIITGGGATARNYQAAGRKVSDVAEEDLDWLGIHATRLNGHLLRSIFRKDAAPALVKNPTASVAKDKPVIIAAGWKPGFSTDYVAVKLAQKVDAQRVVNLSDIKYVYDKNPKKYKDAKPLKTLSWEEFRAIIPSEWSPGLSSPFDPIAAREAQKLKLEVAMIDGTKLSEFEKYLGGKQFVGTKIS